jgi:uncharacterized protein (TIGR02145 family)
LTYSVTNVSGVTYTWSLPSGWSITAGQNSNSITVTAGTSAVAGNISVTPSNSCGNGTVRTLAVTVITTVTDGQGISYTTATFGAAGTWMTQNLRTTTGLTQGYTPNYDSKYYNYPNSSASSPANYGLLYSWAAATGRTGVSTNEANSSTQTQVQGICPSGWHLPSYYEWNQLEEVIAKSAENLYSTTGATTWEPSYSTTTGDRGSHGQKMKSTTDVNTGDSYDPNGTSKTGATGGFDALLVGSVLNGSALNYGTLAYFWSSSSVDSSGAWNRNLNYANTGVYRYGNSKYTMFSVRCKKN